jgi:hypothetical protein
MINWKGHGRRRSSLNEFYIREKVNYTFCETSYLLLRPLNYAEKSCLPSTASTNLHRWYSPAEIWWHTVTHGNGSEGETGEWSGVASTLHITSQHGVSSITTADTHSLAASSRLNWHSPADLNALVRFAERRNPVSARVPSHFNWPLLRLLNKVRMCEHYNHAEFKIWIK